MIRGILCGRHQQMISIDVQLEYVVSLDELRPQHDSYLVSSFWFEYLHMTS
jgi:hypothetical protein